MDEEAKWAAIALQRYTEAENCREKMFQIVEQLKGVDCDLGTSAFGRG